MLSDRLGWMNYKNIICSLVAYFEDVISEAGMWRSFIREHKRLYGRHLPFYTMDENDYFEDEINKEDVQFLLWHFFSLLSREIIDPYDPSLADMAQNIFGVLEEEFETAPPNQVLNDFFIINGEAAGIRTALNFLFYQSYLNRSYTMRLLDETLARMGNRIDNLQKAALWTYNLQTTQIFDNPCPLLALRANEQLANLLGEDHPQYARIKSIDKLVQGTFLFKEEKTDHYLLEHVATGKQIRLTMDNIPEDLTALNPVATKKCLKMGIIPWGEELWCMMGIGIQLDMDKDKSLISREAHLFDSDEEKYAFLDMQEECFRELNNGRNIAYFRDEKEYMGFIDRLNELLFKKHHPDAEYPEKAGKETPEKMEFLAVYFTHRGGAELYPEMAVVIKDANNLYYDPEEPISIEQDMILNNTFSAQFVEYLLTGNLINPDNFDIKMDHRLFLDNLDFMLRYYKPDIYWPVPGVTLMNNEND